MALEIPDDAVCVPGAGRLAILVESVRGGTYGKLILPDLDSHNQTIGRIVAVYDNYIDDMGHEISPMYGVGEIVLFGKYTGTEFQLNRQKMIICKEMDILALIRQPLVPIEPGTYIAEVTDVQR